MIAKHPFTRTGKPLIALLCLFGLFGCGGGGGGGSDAVDGGTAPPQPYPTTFDSSNAVASARAGMKALEALTLPAMVARALALQLIAAGTSSLTVVCPDASLGNVTVFLSRTDADGNGVVSSGDVLRLDQPTPCKGVERSVSVHVLAIDGAPRTLDADVEFTYQYPATMESVTGTFALSFSKRADTGFSFEDRGTTWTISNVSVEATQGSAIETFSNVTLVRSVDALGEYAFDFSGHVDSDLLGFVFDVETSSAISGSLGEFPGLGEVVLSTSRSSVRLTANDASSGDSTVSVDLNSGATGTYVSVADVEWASVVNPDIFAVIPNRAPILFNERILPDTAGAGDDLEFDFQFNDPDGDQVGFSYAWRRNGETLSGEQSKTLSVGHYVKGDEIEATVTASDGVLSSTLSASIVIRDTPAEIVLSMPEDMEYGDSLDVPISLFDVDGDSTAGINLRIEYGPSGMDLDSATGEASWHADLPMFDNVVDVNWSIGTDNSEVEPVSGAIRVLDPTREYVLMRTGVDLPVRNGMKAGDFDSDGDDELLVVGTRSLYELARDDLASYRQVWAYPFSFNELAEGDEDRETIGQAIAYADVDGDGFAEFFVAAGRALVKLDGATRRETERTEIVDFNACEQIEIADLDRNGSREVVCSGNVIDSAGYAVSRALEIFDAADLSIHRSVADADYGSSFALGNVDADPAIEIVTVGGFVLDGATTQVEWSYPLGFGTDVAVGDLDGDGVAEIIGSTWTQTDRWIRAYRGSSGAELWTLTPERMGIVAVTDLTGDGRDELIVGGGKLGVAGGPGDEVSVYGLGPLGVPEPLLSLTGYEGFTQSIAVGDFDGDGAQEIARDAGGSAQSMLHLQILGIEPALTIEWQNEEPVTLNGPFFGGEPVGSNQIDVDGGLLFFSQRRKGDSDDDDGRLVLLDPDTGEIDVGAWLGRWDMGFEIGLAFADYDLDGTDEVFIEQNGAAEFASIYDFFAGTAEWNFDADVSSASAFATADVNGDGREDLVSISSYAELLVYDPTSATVVWQGIAGDGFEAGLDVLVANLDGDGKPDIVAATDEGLYGFQQAEDGSFAQTRSYALRFIDDIALFVDGPSGQDEIAVVARADVLRLDSAFDLIGLFGAEHQPNLAQAYRAAALPSEGGQKNYLLAIGDDNLGATGGSTWIIEIDPDTRTVIWRSPPLVGGTVLNDSLRLVELQGKKRMILGTRAGMFVTR